MSWSEVLKVNSDVTTPLNELMYTLSSQGAYYFTQTSSFVVPTNCTLTIRACGGGGEGASDTGSAVWQGGGGGGGYVKDRRKYKKGDVISISFSSGNVIVSCSDRNLSLTASKGGSASSGTGKGIGGDASGGNLLNMKGGNGAWYTQNSTTSNTYYKGGNASAGGGGCGGGGTYYGSKLGGDGVFAGGHGGSAVVDSNNASGGDGGTGNFCGGSGGWGGNGYVSTYAGRGGNGGDSAWGIGGAGGGSGGTSYSFRRGISPGNGGNGYLMGGNAGIPNSNTCIDNNNTYNIPQKAGDSIVGSGGYPNGVGPGMSGRSYPIRPTINGYGCGGGCPSNNSRFGRKYGGDPICIIEVGLGEGDY